MKELTLKNTFTKKAPSFVTNTNEFIFKKNLCLLHCVTICFTHDVTCICYKQIKIIFLKIYQDKINKLFFILALNFLIMTRDG